MSSSIFILCTPLDYKWTKTLANRLAKDGYPIYLEPLNSTEAIRQKTAQVLYDASTMLAIVSMESAVGESAEVFEAWWRPFLERGDRVIPCIIPKAPEGAEHWMPFDLYRQKPINFQHESAYQDLCAILEPPVRLLAPVESPALTATNEAIFQHQTPTTPETSSDQEIGVFKNLMSLVIGLSAMIVIWMAALGRFPISGSIWLVGLLGILGLIFVIAQFANIRYTRQQQLLKRHQEAKARAHQLGTLQTNAYVLVVESSQADEVGGVWFIEQDMLSIGCDYRVDIPLTDPQLDKTHCTLFEENGRYYLENNSQHRTALSGRRVAVGEVLEIKSGDLLSLGKSVVLQFRVKT